MKFLFNPLRRSRANRAVLSVRRKICILVAGALLAAPGFAAQVVEINLREERDAYTNERGRGFDLGTTRGDQQAFFYSVKVPEGNWRVTVTFGDDAVASETTLKAESRRLLAERVSVPAGQRETRAFVVNVRNASLQPPPKNAPGGTEVRLNDREAGSLTWDDKLTLEFSGAWPAATTLRVEPAPEAVTIFLAGDSTVTDQRFEPAASWGQMLPRFVRPEVAVANHAESGETMKSFLTGLRWAKLLSAVKPGDFVLIQFGHNDSKREWPQTHAPAGSVYPAYLRAFVADVRVRGATPILVTSVHRRQFDKAGRIRNTHGAYLEDVRAVAAAEAVVLVDLAAMSAAFYEALGPEIAPRAFNDGGRDVTHHNNYGAYQLAKAVVHALQGTPAAALFTGEAAAYDPADPDPVETFSVAPSPQRSADRPRGN
ncbi:MAG TPA: rhamnogalacturonan acetylesterase [Candidatus Synoicihabitans sp.]|nr:rhamnogalacturonan acetylesterase [Candidatus Synoicihabitans sp.]